MDFSSLQDVAPPVSGIASSSSSSSQRRPGAASSGNVAFSPGSTFLATLTGPRTIVVRTASSDLSPVRSWTLPESHPAVDRLEWSADGAYLLATSLSRRRHTGSVNCGGGNSSSAVEISNGIEDSIGGVMKIFVLDPRRQPAEGLYEDDPEGNSVDTGAVAHIQAAPAMGLSAAQWGPAAATPTIFHFSADDDDGIGLTATAHCLADSSSALFREVKRPRCFLHPKNRTCFALLHRITGEAASSSSSSGARGGESSSAPVGSEFVGVYGYAGRSSSSAVGTSSAAPQASSYTALLSGLVSQQQHQQGDDCSPGLSEGWQLQAAFSCRTNDAASLSWSPDGSLIAVWEGSMEYKLRLFTSTGLFRGTFMWPSDPSSSSSTSPGSTRAGPLFRPPYEDADHGNGDGAAGFSESSGSTSSAPGKGTVASRSSSGSGSGIGKGVPPGAMNGKRTASGSRSSSGGQQPRQGEGSSEHGEHGIAGGGLGIRTLAWQPIARRLSPAASGQKSARLDGLLAIGGYDERVYLLGPHGDGHPASGDWCVMGSPLDLSRRSFVVAPNTGTASPPAGIYREPRDWIALTGGKGIVPFHEQLAGDTPFSSASGSTSSPSSSAASATAAVGGGGGASLQVSPPALKPDWDKPRPTVGICWMDWDPSGSFLAVRNEAMPSAVFVYSALSAAADLSLSSSRASASQQGLQLLSVMLFASAVSAASWRPALAPLQPQQEQAGNSGEFPSASSESLTSSSSSQQQLAIVAASLPAVYFWTYTCPPSMVEQYVQGQHAPSTTVTQGRRQRARVQVEGVPLPSTVAQSSDAMYANDYDAVNDGTHNPQPVPVPVFRPSRVFYSPDGAKVCVSSSSAAAGSTTATVSVAAYCVGVAVPDDEDEMDEELDVGRSRQ